MKDSDSNQNEPIQDLLASKQKEKPGDEFFENFSDQVLTRLEEPAPKPTLWERLSENVDPFRAAAALFAATVLAIHLVVMLLGVRLANGACGARITVSHMVIASNANVGGSGTAIAMASALGWTPLVAPAAMCGALGYASATAVGLGLEALLLRGS